MMRLLSVLMVVIMAISGFMLLQEIGPSITGLPIVGTRLVIVAESPVLCNITLEQGWNLVSFPCMGSPVPIDPLLENISGHYSDLRTYDSSDVQDPWKSYNPSLPSWVINDLTVMERSRGYWINMDQQLDYIINSTLLTPTIIPVHKGWNLIGYPSTTTRTPNATFNETIPDFDYVYLYNASDDDWKEYTWNASLLSDQDLEYTVPEYGYWIYMLRDGEVPIR